MFIYTIYKNIMQQMQESPLLGVNHIDLNPKTRVYHSYNLCYVLYNLHELVAYRQNVCLYMFNTIYIVVSVWKGEWEVKYI